MKIILTCIGISYIVMLSAAPQLPSDLGSNAKLSRNEVIKNRSKDGTLSVKKNSRTERKEIMNRLQLEKVHEAILKSSTMEERRTALLEMDCLFGRANSENSVVLSEFYNDCVQRVIAEIKTHDKSVPRLWKLYSSGIIVTSGGKVRAFDLNCGCEDKFKRSRLRLKPEIIGALADIIDESYHTHNHSDHFGLELADALLARKKRVICTTDMIRDWLLDGAIDSKELQSNEIKVFHSYQRGAVKGPGVPNSVYILKLKENSHLLVRGDMFDGKDVLALCDYLTENGLRITYAAISPFGTSLPECSAELRKRYQSIIIPIHEWEFSHRVRGLSGKATQTYSEWYCAFPEEVAANRARFLFWGEATSLAE